MKCSQLCYVAVGLLALTACQPRQPDDATKSSATKASDEAAVAKVVQRELDATRANNADSLTAVFSSDATVKPPNELPVMGPALQSWAKNLFANATINQMAKSDEQITVSGDMAVHSYGFELTVTPKGGKATQEKGHGIHILRKQADGSWKLTYDTWSADSSSPTDSSGA